MRKLFVIAAAALVAGAAPPPAKRPLLSMWRLDCGSLTEKELLPPWSDGQMPLACYLVRHGDDYLLFDAGLSAKAIGANHPKLSLKRTIVDQLRDIGVGADQVKHVAISHYHGDHSGQAAHFPKARLLIGAGDLEALKRTVPPQGAAPTHFTPWLTGGAPMSVLTEDFDVYGDGSVVVLATPGHTEGHRSLLVKLASKPVILSGDLWASADELLTGDMAPFNTSPAETEASRERVRRLALRHSALLVIAHEPRDVALLPAFPAAAE